MHKSEFGRCHAVRNIKQGKKFEQEKRDCSVVQFSIAGLHGVGDGRFSGKVERLNYALHGEVNGAILHTGDFLHVKPRGAAALALAVGMTVKAAER